MQRKSIRIAKSLFLWISGFLFMAVTLFNFFLFQSGWSFFFESQGVHCDCLADVDLSLGMAVSLGMAIVFSEGMALLLLIGAFVVYDWKFSKKQDF